MLSPGLCVSVTEHYHAVKIGLQDYFFFDFLAVDFLVELLEDFFLVLLDWDFFLEAEGFLEAMAFFDEGV